MPKVKHPTVGGRFLSPNDIVDGAIVKIVGAGEYKLTDFNPNRLELPIVPHSPPKWDTEGSDQKTWGMNPTTEATLCSGVKDGIAGYGMDTETWIDRLAKISKVKQMVGGNLKTILYGEPVEGAPPSQATLKAQPTATPPTEGDTTTYTEAETVWIRYNELAIGKVLDPQDWQRIPKTVKEGLQEKGILIDQEGYPFLTEDARKALE